jgi:formate dehydrogenase gamma subunit
MVVHLVLRRRLARRAAAVASGGGEVATTVPERVLRHSLASRLFHWLMAVAMLVLLVTGFLPQVGIQFPWVTAHWVAGLVLIVTIVYHMVHATFYQSLRNIWISLRDLKEWLQEMRHDLGGRGEAPPKPGKYPVDHKLFHHAVTLAGFAAMITGVLMMYRIENPLTTRDPYLFTDATWGWIYVIHGLGGVVLVTTTMAHIYFAVLPEKRWITLSMIFGWIRGRDYVAHHDPKRWSPKGAAKES